VQDFFLAVQDFFLAVQDFFLAMQDFFLAMQDFFLAHVKKIIFYFFTKKLKFLTLIKDQILF
jgi:hypothetical protein